MGILRLDRHLALDRVDDRHREIDPGKRRAAAEIARRKHVHFEDLVTDDVDPDEEHAVGDELRPDQLGDLQFGLADLHRFGGAAGVDVGANIVL